MSTALARRLFEAGRNLSLDTSRLRELQWKKFKALLAHSYQNVPFYHEKFFRAKIKPEDVLTIRDLHRIPLTTKTELQQSPIESTVARNIDLNRCVKTWTTGSTGMPLTLFYDKRMVNYCSGLWTRTYLRNGLKLTDMMAIIRDPVRFPKSYWFQKLGLMRRTYISATQDTEHQIRLLDECNPDAIKSYPSSLVEIARARDLLKRKSQFRNPRIVFTGAELMDQRTRSLISSSFGSEPLDNYGNMEFCLVAWECKKHSGYHVNIDSVLVEFLDDQEDVAPGERGQVVCTGLNNYVMPLIRYRLDDFAIPQKEGCSCGVKLPLLKSLEGRENDFLMTPSGRLISPLQFLDTSPFGDYAGIKQFRIVQDRRERIKYQLIVDRNIFDFSRLEEARATIQRIFREEMQVDFEILDELEKDNSGKLRIVSRLF